jgi:hypothetical protein
MKNAGQQDDRESGYIANRARFRTPRSHKMFSDTDLRGFTPGWGCYSIFVENPLQIGRLFFKTKPICRRRKIQISSFLTKDYEEKACLARQLKQSQIKPISSGA